MEPISSRLRLLSNSAAEIEHNIDGVVMCAGWLVAAVLGERPGDADELRRLALQTREAMTRLSGRPVTIAETLGDAPPPGFIGDAGKLVRRPDGSQSLPGKGRGRSPEQTAAAVERMNAARQRKRAEKAALDALRPAPDRLQAQAPGIAAVRDSIAAHDAQRGSRPERWAVARASGPKIKRACRMMRGTGLLYKAKGGLVGMMIPPSRTDAWARKFLCDSLDVPPTKAHIRTGTMEQILQGLPE